MEFFSRNGCSGYLRCTDSAVRILPDIIPEASFPKEKVVGNNRKTIWDYISTISP